MSHASDRLRRQADSARAAAGIMSRRDMRHSALDMAAGLDRQADEAEGKREGQDQPGD
ncbi:hypothetical protein [Desertibaculum subflavum]|uniref:hypothetical protein n=1 Tax=Desertibaculum subflavum TaxID=2268458 RepID=UPI0013C4341A